LGNPIVGILYDLFMLRRINDDAASGGGPSGERLTARALVDFARNA